MARSLVLLIRGAVRTCRVVRAGEGGPAWAADAAGQSGHKDSGLRAAAFVSRHINPSVRFYRRKLYLLSCRFCFRLFSFRFFTYVFALVFGLPPSVPLTLTFR